MIIGITISFGETETTNHNNIEEQYEENARSTSTEEQLNKLYIHKMEYYSAKSCKLLMYTKTGRNLRKLCEVKEVRHKRVHLVLFHLYEVQNRRN